jgi:hypothetical protein
MVYCAATGSQYQVYMKLCLAILDLDFFCRSPQTAAQWHPVCNSTRAAFAAGR